MKILSNAIRLIIIISTICIACKNATLLERNDKLIDSCVKYTFSSIRDSVPFEKTIDTLNSKGQVIVSSIFKWDYQNKNWMINARILMNYNSLGKIISKFKYYFNHEKKIWEISPGGLSENESSNFIKRYDSLGRITLEINDSIYKTETSYNSRENYKVEIYYMKDSPKEDWKPNEKTITFYDPKGKELGTFLYSWNEKSSDWIEHARYLKQYDSLGRHSTGEDIFWNSKKWVHKTRHCKKIRSKW